MYVNPNGNLYRDDKMFFKCCFAIDGFKESELPYDAYELNEESNEDPNSKDFNRLVLYTELAGITVNEHGHLQNCTTMYGKQIRYIRIDGLIKYL